MKRIIVAIAMFIIGVIEAVKKSIELNKASEALFQTINQGKTEFAELTASINAGSTKYPILWKLKRLEDMTKEELCDALVNRAEECRRLQRQLSNIRL